MKRKIAFTSWQVLLLFVLGVPAELAAASNTGPHSAVAVPPDRFVIREVGPIGNIVRQNAERDPADYKGFLNLPAAERERIIAELNAWSLRVVDVVEPKSTTADGSIKAWRFTSKRDPTVEVVPSRAGTEIGQIRVRSTISVIRHRSAESSDAKQFILDIEWIPAKGHEVKIRSWLKGTAFNINSNDVLSADPIQPQPAPATQPTGAQDRKH